MNLEEDTNNIEVIKGDLIAIRTERKLQLNNFVKFCYFIDFSEDFDTMMEQFKKLKYSNNG